MTRPTAPCLTADYYTYSTYSQRDDYYGGFEPKNERNEYNHISGPMRREPEKGTVKIQRAIGSKTSSTHCLSSTYFSLAVIMLSIAAFLYYNGLRITFVFYFSAAMGLIVLTSIMMHIGIIRQQPFFCIPFAVLRTLETFVSGALLSLFTYAAVNPGSNLFKFLVQCTKEAAKMITPHIKLDFVDTTLQLCIIGWTISLLFFGVSLYACIKSIKCVVLITDQMRHKRYQQHAGTSQTRFAGDEFYCA